MTTLRNSAPALDAANRPSPALGTYVALVLVGLVPIWLFVSTSAAAGVTPWGHVAIMALAGLRYAWLMASASRHLYEMVLWLFIYVFLGMAPFVQQALGIEPSTTQGLRAEYFGPAVAAVLIGAVASILGSYWAGQKKIHSFSVGRTVVASRANLLAVMALAMGAYCGSKIGFGTYIGSRTDLGLARQAAWPQTAVNGLVTGALNFGLLVAFVAQMHLRSQAKLEGRPAPVFLPLITGAALLYFVNPVSSSRYMVGTAILGVLAAFGAYKTVKRYRFIAGAALVGMITIFPLADAFRFSKSAAVEAENPIQSMVSGDFDAFGQIVNTMEYVSERGISWGGQLLGVIFVWVPRNWWPDKPIDTGTLLAEYKGYGFTNISSPMWSEMYINGGWVLLVVGMALMGFYFRVSDTKAEHALAVSALPPVSVCVIPFYLLIVLRGSLLNAASALVVIILCSWFVTRKQPDGPATS